MTAPTFQPVSLAELLLRLFPLGHISPSAVKQHSRCPEQFRRVRLLGEKAAPSAALVQGSADHAAVAFNYAQKIDTERDLPIAEVKEFFASDLDRRLEEEEVDWSAYEDKTPVQARALVKDQGAQLVGLYQERIAPEIFPATIEEGFELDVAGVPVPVKGYIDLTARRYDPLTATDVDRDGTFPFIIERKTRGQNRPPKPEDLFQTRVYQLFKPLPAEIQISVRSKVPQVAIHEAPLPGMPERTAASLKASVLEIAHNFALYGLDSPWPDRGRTHDWACSYCSVKPTCVWWESEWWPK